MNFSQVKKWYIPVNGVDKEVKSVSVNGVELWKNAPTIDPVLGNNTWEAIKYACDNDLIPSTWNLGDTINMVAGNGNTYTLRLVDKIKGRYQDTSGNDKNLTFEFTSVLEDPLQMDNVNGNIWSGTTLFAYMNTDTFLSTYLSSELKSILTETKYYERSTRTGENAILTQSKLFLGSANEYGTYQSSSNVKETIKVSDGTTQCGQWEYYAPHLYDNSYRLKYSYGTTNGNAYFTRSTHYRYTDEWICVSGTGSMTTYARNSTCGTVPSFAI